MKFAYLTYFHMKYYSKSNALPLICTQFTIGVAGRFTMNSNEISILEPMHFILYTIVLFHVMINLEGC